MIFAGMAHQNLNTEAKVPGVDQGQNQPGARPHAWSGEGGGPGDEGKSRRPKDVDHAGIFNGEAAKPSALVAPNMMASFRNWAVM